MEAVIPAKNYYLILMRPMEKSWRNRQTELKFSIGCAAKVRFIGKFFVEVRKNCDPKRCGKKFYLPALKPTIICLIIFLIWSPGMEPSKRWASSPMTWCFCVLVKHIHFCSKS